MSAAAVRVVTGGDAVHIGLRPLGGERCRCRGSRAQSPCARVIKSVASDHLAVRGSRAPASHVNGLLQVVMELILYEQMHGPSVAVTRTVEPDKVVIGVEIVFPLPSPAVTRDAGQPAALPASPNVVAAPVAAEASVMALPATADPRMVPADTAGAAAAPPMACIRRRWRAGRLAAPAVPAVPIADDVNAAASDRRRRRRTASLSTDTV